jgi:hypothetical protein
MRITLACLALLLVVACRTAPVHDVPRTGWAIQSTPTMADLSEAIWAAGRREGWRVREVSPGVLRAEKTLRTHRALVEIDYDTTGYSIRLLEADNLLYDGRSIHDAYNEWVVALDKSIRDEMRFRHP